MAKEIELKYLLSERSYRALLNATRLQKSTVSSQHNRYFDTPQRTLARRHMALRVRTVGNRHILTVKAELRVKTRLGLSVREELECAMAPRALKLLMTNPNAASLATMAPWRRLKETLTPKQLAELECVAQMWTERVSRSFGKGIVLELDRVKLEDGQVFYEAELESRNPSKARAFLEKLFQTVGVKARPIRRTKLARVMRSKRK